MSSLTYADGEWNAASGTRAAFGGLSDALVAEGYPAIRVTSGDRSTATQISIFVDRYDQWASGSGPYNDVRWWNGAADGYPGGTRWVRVKGGGTVAPPRSSSHESMRSNDLAAPYNADTAAHRRARQLAVDFGIKCDGIGFGEYWHWTYTGPLGGTAAGGGSTPFIPPANTTLEVPMAFDMTRPIYRHTGINKYIVLDLLRKQARIIEPSDWEQTMINEENDRISDRVRNVEKRDWHVTDGVHRDITPEQWVAAFADFTYV